MVTAFGKMQNIEREEKSLLVFSEYLFVSYNFLFKKV